VKRVRGGDISGGGEDYEWFAWDNRRKRHLMDDSPSKPRWWLIATAAVLAVLTLYYYTGSWVVVVLFFAGFGAFVAYQAGGREKDTVRGPGGPER